MWMVLCALDCFYIVGVRMLLRLANCGMTLTICSQVLRQERAKFEGTKKEDTEHKDDKCLIMLCGFRAKLRSCPLKTCVPPVNQFCLRLPSAHCLLFDQSEKVPANHELGDQVLPDTSQRLTPSLCCRFQLCCWQPWLCLRLRLCTLHGLQMTSARFGLRGW